MTQTRASDSFLIIHPSWLRVGGSIGPHDWASVLIRKIKSERALLERAEQLAALARQAYTARRLDVAKRLSQIILSLPLPDRYRNIGLYYLTLCEYVPDDRARPVLEQIAENIIPRYKARVIKDVAGVAFHKGDYSSALSLYVEAGRMAASRDHADLLTAFQVQRTIATLKGIKGDNRGALADLEKLWPLAQTIKPYYPQLYYDFLNNLAVELAELGRLEEAERACKATLVSPFAQAYPEWFDTYREIKARRRRASHSVISVSWPGEERKSVAAESGEPGAEMLGGDLLSFAGRGPTVAPSARPASPEPLRRDAQSSEVARPKAQVVSIAEWQKKKAAKRFAPAERVALRLQIKGLTRAGKRVRIVELVYTDGLSQEKLESILEFAELVVPAQDLNSEKLTKILDLVGSAIYDQ